MRRVFISYSHDSDQHRDRVAALADGLRGRGFGITFDLDVKDPTEGWARWMEKEVSDADRLLMVFTRTYRSRYDGEQPPQAGRGVAWETHLIRNALYDSVPFNERIRVVTFSPEDERYVPLLLRPYSRYLLPNKLDELCAWLGKPAISPTVSVNLAEGHQVHFAPLEAPQFITRGGLRSDDPSYIRRKADSEIAALLDNTSTSCISIIGYYGIGKTSLLNRVPSMLGKEWLPIRPSIADLRSDKATLCVSNLFEEFECIGGKVGKWSELEDFFREQPSMLLLDDFGELQEDGLSAIMPKLVELAVDSDGKFRIIATLPEGICGLLKKRGVRNPKHHKPWKEVKVLPFQHAELCQLLQFVPIQMKEVVLRYFDTVKEHSQLHPQCLKGMLNVLSSADMASWPELVNELSTYQ